MNAAPDIALAVSGLSVLRPSAVDPALQQIDLTVRTGAIVLLIGPTGSGKSTLLQCLNGIIPRLIPAEVTGRIEVLGQDIVNMDVAQLAGRTGTVLQDPEIQLFSVAVRDELAFGPENLGLPVPEILTRVAEAAHAVDVVELLDREPSTLSGGQQQSVVVGAVSTMRPDVLLLDEPTSNLDPAGVERVIALIKRINRVWGKTIILAEHNIDAVAGFVDEVVVLANGRVVKSGPAKSVFSDPESLHAWGLRAPAVTELYIEMTGDRSDQVPLTVDDAVEALRCWAR